MSNEFTREERYIVFKLSDLGNSLKGDEIRKLAREYAEHLEQLGKKPLDYVVIAADWSEYGPTWKALEVRVTGEQPAPSVPEGVSFVDTNQLEGAVSTEIVHSYPPPSGWLRAIDEALVVAHLGVANASDTYEQAKNKLINLIGWHVDVATDPAVNGGWKLVPLEPTSEMLCAGEDALVPTYTDTPVSVPFDVYRAMLAAAPEAKEIQL